MNKMCMAMLRGAFVIIMNADAKLTCSRQSLCVVNVQPVGNPKRKV
jgi:hypothetical protein